MFNNLHLKATYSTYENDIGNEFYTPVLSNAITYDRASAYFSAKALSNYAQGLQVFSNKGRKFRLIISSELSEDDFNEIKTGYTIKEDIIANMLNNLKEDISLKDEFNLSNLAYYIAIGTIEVKIAFTRSGIFHDKFGVLKDEHGNIISFRGSNNETNAAFNSNYESFDITCNWQCSDFDLSKINKSINVFEKLWNNETDNIFVTDIDNVLKKEILKYNKGKVLLEPVLLEKDGIILDYTNQLHLILNIDENILLNSMCYKLKLKRHIESINNGIIYFHKSYTYTKFKQIIDILLKETKQKNYNFHITNRLNKLIKDKELYIYERSRVGLAIKNQDTSVYNLFSNYKKIVDENMSRQLRDKQMWDSFFMYTMKKASNFSVPGSGKTSSVLGVFAYLNYMKLVDKIVVVGPKNSFGSWIDEFNICFKDKKVLKLFNIQHYSNIEEKKHELTFNTGGKNLLLFNYESLHSITEELSNLINTKTLLVFDEVHKVKAIGGQRAYDALEISKNSLQTITMTGTPIPNSYADLKNILHILYNDEYNDFFNFSDMQLRNPTAHDVEHINDKIQPFFCRTTKEQLNVPAANSDITLNVYSSDTENKIFDILCMKYRKNKLALIIRILQLESNPKMLLNAIDINQEDFSDILYTDGSIEEIDYVDYSDDVVTLINSIQHTSKFTSCIEKTINLVRENKTVIIWCIFVDSINNLRDELYKKGIKVGVIYGGVDNEIRDVILNKFRNNEIDVIITNPHTLAESVSLHSVCHDAIYFEYSYNLVHLLQSKDRIHRLGLNSDQYTQYYYMNNIFSKSDSSQFSLDYKIYERLMLKEQIMLDAIENNCLDPISATEEDLEIIFKELN